MDESVAAYAPGQSPFHVKGVGYRGHLTYIAEHLPGGVDAMLAELDTDAEREFFLQPFVAGGWYDVLPLVNVGTVCARLFGVSVHTFLRRRTEHQVSEDLRGVYQFLSRLVSRGVVLRALEDGLARYYDFLTPQTVQLASGNIESHVRGLPTVMAPWFKIVFPVYCEVALIAAGKAPLFSRARMGSWRGEKDGAPLLEVILDIRWHHVSDPPSVGHK